MARQKNIKIQLNQKIDSFLCIGESKHQAKQVYKDYCKSNNIKYNPSKTIGIYSTSTAENYRQVIGEFSEWLKENHSNVWQSKDLSEIDESIAYQYLQFRDEKNSAWSTSKDLAGLNKVLNLELTKKEGNLKQRRLQDITRSRNLKIHNKSYNPDNYKEQILIARAFGLRRESILGGNYQIKDVSLFSHDGDIYCSVIEKGGKYREAICLKKYQNEVIANFTLEEREPLAKENFVVLYNSSENLLFESYTSKIDNHSFRSEYATSLYNELTDANYYADSEVYKGYIVDALKEVSECLGHNRISVVIQHYLR